MKTMQQIEAWAAVRRDLPRLVNVAFTCTHKRERIAAKRKLARHFNSPPLVEVTENPYTLRAARVLYANGVEVARYTEAGGTELAPFLRA